MTLEIFIIIVAAVGGLVSFVLSLSKDDSKAKRRLRYVALVLGAVSGLALLEVNYRRQGMADATAAIDRRWTVLQSLKIDAIQVAYLLPDGVASYSDVLQDARTVRVSMPGVRLFPPSKTGTVSTIELASAFAPDFVRQHGRVGVAQASVAAERDGQRSIDSVTCIESDFTTQEVVSRSGDALNSSLVCSVTVTLPVVDGITLRALQNPAVRVEVTLGQEPSVHPCFGPCKQSPLLSVRLMAREAGQLLPTLLEVSPLLYNVPPARKTNKGLPVGLPGPDILKLVDSRFHQSYGFRDPGAFAFTKGAVGQLWQWLTVRDMRAEFVDVVWVTDASPPEEAISNAISPASRSNAEPFRMDEWCGLGEQPVCWSRFAVFKPVAK